MPITSTAKVEYNELDNNPNLKGTGAQIPIFIGKTDTHTAAPTVIKKFKSYSAANKTVANGGIGVESGTNLLLKRLKEFFTESAKTSAEEVGINYVYVIDLGTAPTTNNWNTAIETAKLKTEIEVEVYCGTNEIAIMEAANTSILTETIRGNPRIAYFTIDEASVTDAQLIKLTDDTQDSFIQRSRIGIIEPLLFGKTVAKICTTPYYEEPGFTHYRSVEQGTFIERKDSEQLALQNAGIIFNRDEKTRKKIYPKINLGVSTSFAKDSDARPNDTLLHARRNVDNLIRLVYDACYVQLKRNETEINLKHLKTDIDKIVDDELDKGFMMQGTEINVQESDSDPYDLEVTGSAKPVNSTLLVKFGLYISAPNARVVDEL